MKDQTRRLRNLVVCPISFAMYKLTEVRLEDDGKNSSNTEVGIVPLLNFRVEWLFASKMSLLLEGDALASPGGQVREEDVLLALFYRLNYSLSLKAGYRILEGGADVEGVYNFTLLHYVIAGVSFRFGGNSF